MTVYNLPDKESFNVLLTGDPDFVLEFADILDRHSVPFNILPTLDDLDDLAVRPGCRRHVDDDHLAHATHGRDDIQPEAIRAHRDAGGGLVVGGPAGEGDLRDHGPRCQRDDLHVVHRSTRRILRDVCEVTRGIDGYPEGVIDGVAAGAYLGDVPGQCGGGEGQADPAAADSAGQSVQPGRAISAAEGGGTAGGGS